MPLMATAASRHSVSVRRRQLAWGAVGAVATLFLVGAGYAPDWLGDTEQLRHQLRKREERILELAREVARLRVLAEGGQDKQGAAADPVGAPVEVPGWGGRRCGAGLPENVIWRSKDAGKHSALPLGQVAAEWQGDPRVEDAFTDGQIERDMDIELIVAHNEGRAAALAEHRVRAPVAPSDKTVVGPAGRAARGTVSAQQWVRWLRSAAQRGKTLGEVPTEWRTPIGSPAADGEEPWMRGRSQGEMDLSGELDWVSSRRRMCAHLRDYYAARGGAEFVGNCSAAVRWSCPLSGGADQRAVRCTVTEVRRARADEDPPAELASVAVIAVLLSLRDTYLWRMLRSVCRNLPSPHPILFFWTSDEKPSDESVVMIIEVLSQPDCLVPDRQVWFVALSDRWWSAADPRTTAGKKVRASEQDKHSGAVLHAVGYRRMCWFWHRSVWRLPVLSRARWLLRLDTDSSFPEPVPEAAAPVTAVQQAGAVYGYVSFCYDNPRYTHGIWEHVREYAAQHSLQPRWADWEFCSGNCTEQPFGMFFTNLEVADMDFFRSARVDHFLLSALDGIFRYRWGDAPLRAAVLALFASPQQALHLSGFSYLHGRSTSSLVLHKGNALGVRWARGRAPHWEPEVGALADQAGIRAQMSLYYQGICFGLPAVPARDLVDCERWSSVCDAHIPPAHPLPRALRNLQSCPGGCEFCDAEEQCGDIAGRRQRRAGLLRLADQALHCRPGMGEFRSQRVAARQLRALYCRGRLARTDWPQCRDWIRNTMPAVVPIPTKL